jgi:hypothetical protein
MTQSQQPIFNKVSTRRMDIVQACEKIGNLMLYHMRLGFALIKVVRRQNISHSMTSQGFLNDTAQSHNVSKDLIRRHQKA